MLVRSILKPEKHEYIGQIRMEAMIEAYLFPGQMELFNNLIAASEKMKVNQNKITTWETMLNKMPDYMIDENDLVLCPLD